MPGRHVRSGVVRFLDASCTGGFWVLLQQVLVFWLDDVLPDSEYEEMRLKTVSARLLVAAMLLPAIGTASEEDLNTRIEFLWSPAPKGAIARQETLGFVLNGNQHHQVCVAVLGSSPVEINVLRIEAIDALGQLVSRQDHEDFRGPKRCYEAGLNMNGNAGEWTFKAYLDGALAATRTIEVAKSLETASFYKPSSIPYVLGRPNYDPTIPPSEFLGRLVWVMHINESGAVTKVEVEVAEGVGILMKERAIAAGYMSLFPPDPSRAKQSSTYRRELTFKPD